MLWSARRPLLPAEILELTGFELAYTSVATVLSRLLEKGLVRRHPNGKAYVWESAITESELAARRIGALLDRSSSRRAALAGFAQALGKRDAQFLRSLLDERSPANHEHDDTEDPPSRKVR